MSTWNMFDPEILQEMLKPWRGIGTRHAPTYRAQAKAELARRLVLEDELKHLKQEKSDLETGVEVLCEYIRWPIDEWEEKRKTIPDYVLEHIDKRYASQGSGEAQTMATPKVQDTRCSQGETLQGKEP